jgi:uncharacterized protein YjiS (DUF1127 family)
MAYANVTRAAQGGIADRFAAVVKSLKTSVAKRRKYMQTYRELNALTARELADLGIRQVSFLRSVPTSSRGRS